MWDNAPLLRSIANALFGLSLVLVLYGVVRYVLRLPVFPLRAVELTAAPQRVPTELFEKLPWVRKVSVRRKFPWSLEVEVEEQVALAHWNGKELVNTHGEVFAGKADEDIPVFIGQPDSSAQVTQMYGELNAVLQPMKQQIAQISLSPRYAWQVKLDNGMVLELGREEMQQRLKRFVTVYPYSLAALARPASRVDLRYRNGFAAQMAGNV
jgi:cell division protein FtsQ